MTPKSGSEVAEEAWAESLSDYRPAFPLGNERDATIIAEKSGRSIDEFLQPSRLAIESTMESEVVVDEKN